MAIIDLQISIYSNSRDIATTRNSYLYNQIDRITVDFGSLQATEAEADSSPPFEFDFDAFDHNGYLDNLHIIPDPHNYDIVDSDSDFDSGRTDPHSLSVSLDCDDGAWKVPLILKFNLL